MSAISFHFVIALLEVAKRLWFTRGKQFSGPHKVLSVPPQVGTPRHGLSALFELP